MSESTEYGDHSDKEHSARNFEMNNAISAENSVVRRERSTNLIP